MPELDLLITAGRVLTPDVVAGERGAGPGYVGIRDGVIAAVGAGAPEMDATRVLDLGPATLSPGFIDGHIHPVFGLQMARGVDLSGIRDRETARAKLREATREDGWLLGWGLDPAALDGVFDNSILDGIAQDELVHITLFDGHGSLVSDAAIALAGITGTETFEDSSSVVVDDQGRPTGVLFEVSASRLVESHLPHEDAEGTLTRLAALLQGMAESGLVAGQMLDLARPDSLDVLDALEARMELPIRLRVSPWIMPGYSDADLDAIIAMQGRHGRRWEVRGVKLMIDGTIDNGTAWLFEPDTHGESTSSLWLDTDEYRRALARLHAERIPTTTHAIGDKGISFVAESVGALERNGTQHRIEHIETLPDSVLQQMVDAGVAAGMQPTHCTLYALADHTDNWSQRLGDERADLAWRIGDLRARGVIVALGSDWPVAPYDPRPIFAAAQLRRNAGRLDEQPNRPEQALSARRALEGYTSEFWRSVGESGGRIEVGARADLTGFADDPLTTDPDAFAETAVVLTVVDGAVVVDPVVGRSA